MEAQKINKQTSALAREYTEKEGSFVNRNFVGIYRFLEFSGTNIQAKLLTVNPDMNKSTRFFFTSARLRHVSNAFGNHGLSDESSI